MTPRTIMTLSFTLAAFVASGSFLSACGSSPDGENLVTYRETESTEGNTLRGTISQGEQS